MQDHPSPTTGQSGLDLKFPPLSSTVREINRLIRLGSQSTDELAAAIESDPMMAATVLRRVNSAFYGVRRQIADLKKAVYLLGFQDVSNLVLSASILRLADMVSGPHARQLFADLMQMNLGTALYAQLIADELGLEDSATAYTAGLMHSSGRVVLLFNYGETYSALCRPGSTNAFPAASQERTAIGIDNAQAGGLAMTEWQMPQDLVQIVSCLEAPGRIEDKHLRELALCVNVGISATRQLCLRRETNLTFEAKAALHVVARLRGRAASEITGLINQERDNVNSRIALLAGDLMMS